MQTLLQLLNTGINNPKLDTGSKSLNDLLGGGVPYGCVTELVGEAGAGKTQVILQLAVKLVADGNLAVILDTEGKICSERLLQMMESCEVDESALDKVLIRRCRNQSDLLATVQLLPCLLKTQKNIGGVFIDSIAQPFRFTENLEARQKNGGLLYRICEILNRLASENNLFVIISNQITVKIGDDTSSIIPALGESWAHAPSTRVLLGFKETEVDGEYTTGNRTATLLKSPSNENKTVHFEIRTEGIRDTE